MKKTILAALVISASIGSQVSYAATTATTKVGKLTFALTDTYQWTITTNGVQSANGPSTVVLEQCLGTIKYVSQTKAINTRSVITAIGKALHLSFTASANLALLNYDNDLNAPPYPPYLPALGPANTFNGPRDTAGNLIAAMGVWPNALQIDWVEYDRVNAPGDVGADLWPKAWVVISDPKGANSCVDVTPFFSFEEAYCYFCWDTVDRVTSGQIKAGLQTSGNACLSPNGCGVTGNGTTRFYLKIKFDNVYPSENGWLASDNFALPVYDVNAVDRLAFSVDGVVVYPWVIKQNLSVPTAFGTMSMSTADGYGAAPFCGTIKGSVVIAETTDAVIPVCTQDIPTVD